MNIGIDIDGVLSDYGKFVYKFGKKYLKKNNIGYRVIGKGEYFFDDVFETEKPVSLDFWHKHLPDYVRYSKPIKGSVKYLKKLEQEGHHLFIVTARDYDCGFGIYDNEVQTMTMDWLDYYDIPYERFWCDDHNKAKVCTDHKVDVMIDDTVKNLEMVMPVCDCIVFDQLYNRNYNNEKVKRAHNWKEVYKIIKEKENERTSSI